MTTKLTLVIAGALALAAGAGTNAHAQNTSPYWSLAGNSNATTSSKLGTTNGVPLRLVTKNVARVTIDSTGRVAIGINTPAARLHVNTSGTTPPLLLQVNGTTNLVSGTNGGLSVGSGSTAPSNGLYVAGNVGIGTNSPGYLLDVAGRIRLRSASGGNTAGLWLNNTTNSTVTGFIGVAQEGRFGFYGAVSGWSLIMNSDNGNVGIGTFNPAYKLSVNGTVQAKEVRVETSWSDYVFEPGYKLRSLAEVERYITQHKHLPGIVPASEVQQKGLAVADMQTKMMAKIEELTLYVIDLQKQIAQLKAGTK